MEVTEAPWRGLNRYHSSRRPHQTRCTSSDYPHIRADIDHYIPILKEIGEQLEDFAFVGPLVCGSAGPI